MNCIECEGGFNGLRSGTGLSAFALQAASALFPPLRSHLGLCRKVLVADWDRRMAKAIGLERILTFA